MSDKKLRSGESLEQSDAAKTVIANRENVVTRVVSTDEGETVASVLASDKGAIVARIEALAAQHDIPLLQDAMLTDLLTNVPCGDVIPDNVYLTVAEVLSCIYGVHQQGDV
jgi:type III secretion system FlhB-like substrate exporter